MNIKELKNLIKDLPDDMNVRTRVSIHIDDVLYDIRSIDITDVCCNRDYDNISNNQFEFKLDELNLK